MPSLTPRSVQFGVRIPPDRIVDQSLLSIRRRFRIQVVWTSGTVLTSNLLVSIVSGSAGFSALFILMEILAMWAVYLDARKHLRRVKIAEKWTEGYMQKIPAVITPERPASVRMLLYFVMPLTVIITTAAVAVREYPYLHQFLPVKFSGPDPVAFAHKTIQLVLTPIYSQLIFLIIYTVLVFVLCRVKLVPEYPDLDRSLTVQRHFRLGVIFALSVLLTMVELDIMLSGMAQWEIIPGIFTEFSAIPSVVGLVLVVAIISRMGHSFANPRNIELEGTKRIMNMDDDAFWKAGMIYYNRDDPSLIVPKRFGIGYTVNYGNPFIKIAIFIVMTSAALFAIRFMVL
ncbi:MAG: DUF5808 domain-containing protein [Thermoplasmataceae archaeon]